MLMLYLLGPIARTTPIPARRNARSARCAPRGPSGGRPQHALHRLERAERIAETYGQPIDVAIARYQRGLRLGGDEGKALMRSAEQAVVRAGSRTLLLHEDPSRR
jgi:hypothetical protein